MTPSNVDIAGTGFAALDRVYANNEKAFEALGGSCGNVLISLAMLERSVVPLLSLGQDAVGNSLVDEFVHAGANTNYITRSQDIASPVLAQWLDIESAQHSFSFVCPETNEALPAYHPIDEVNVDHARPVLDACAVFYTDRLSDAILRAMETAQESGALVFFEPSSICDEDLFERALQFITILKYSSERLHTRFGNSELKKGTMAIVTHGSEGLEIRIDGRQEWCAAFPAAVVRDTCGAGDMVSVGMIDWILGRESSRGGELYIEDVISGVLAGQRLAAVNCEYPGARGLFKRHGAHVARMILDDRLEDVGLQPDLFEDELWFS